MSTCTVNTSDKEVQKRLQRYGAEAGLEIAMLQAKNPSQQPEKEKEENRYKMLLSQKTNEISMIDESISKTKDVNRITQLTNRKTSIEKELEDLLGHESFSRVIQAGKDDVARVTEILKQDKINESDLLYTMKVLDFWGNDGAAKMLPQFDIDSRSDNFLALEEIRKDATSIKSREWNTAAYNISKQKVEKETGKPLTQTHAEKLFTQIDEEWAPSAQMLDASHSKNTSVKVLDKVIKESNIRAEIEANEAISDIDKEVNKLIKSGAIKSEKDLETIFTQRDGNGNPTGYIVNRFSTSFFSERWSKKPKGSAANEDYAWDNYKNWLKENTIMFDTRKLFYEEYKKMATNPEEFSKEDIEKHITDLKRQLGVKGYARYYNKQREQFEKFKKMYDVKKETIDSTNEPDNIKMQLMDDFLAQWSPFEQAQRFYSNMSTKAFQSFEKFSGWQFVTSVPRRYDTSGKETTWYDKDFDKIEANDNLTEFYEFMMDSLNTFKAAFPKYATENLQYNYLPDLPKTFWEGATANNIGKRVYDKFIDEISMQEMYADWKNLDANGKPMVSLPMYMVGNKYTTLTSEELEIILLEAQRLHPKDTKKQYDYKKQRRSEMIQEKLKGKSFDIAKVLKAFAASSTLYKHKAQVEDWVRLMHYQINQAMEIQRNSRGDQIVHDDSDLAVPGAKNAKAQLDYMVDVFYGRRQSKPEASKNKVYKWEESKQRKALKADLEAIKQSFGKGEINDEEYEKRLKEIGLKLEQLGEQRWKGGTAELLMKYVRLKGLGWNTPAAAVNLSYGYVSNLTHASGGEDFDIPTLNRAYYKMWSSVGKLTKDSKKLQAVMERYGFVGDTTEDALNKKKTIGKKLWNLVLPFELIRRVEFINQGATAMAMMMNTKVMVNGEEKNLYEAMDDEGNLVDGVDSKWKEEIFKFKLKVESIKKKIHGNYDPNSPVMIKKTQLGRMLTMFRSWVAEGAKSRFGLEGEDVILDRKTKGRYRTLATSINIDGTENNWRKNVQHLLKELLRQSNLGLIYKNKGLDELSDVDKANMKKNATELMLLMALYLSMMMLVHAVGDDEEDEIFLNPMINVGHRLIDDIGFYFNPMSTWSIIQDPLPTAKIVTDIGEWFWAAGKYMGGEDILQSGPDKGNSRLGRETFQLFPFLNSVSNLNNYSKSIYTNTMLEDITE